MPPPKPLNRRPPFGAAKPPCCGLPLNRWGSGVALTRTARITGAALVFVGGGQAGRRAWGAASRSPSRVVGGGGVAPRPHSYVWVYACVCPPCAPRNPTPKPDAAGLQCPVLAESVIMPQQRTVTVELRHSPPPLPSPVEGGGRGGLPLTGRASLWGWPQCPVLGQSVIMPQQRTVTVEPSTQTPKRTQEHR
jgi:hypothetical protein